MSSTLENAQSPSERNLPTGTFLLIRDDEYNDCREKTIMLDPIPSNDPNEPLNWSIARKAINFTLVLAISCLIFTAISIQLIFWQEMVVDLNVTYAQLNNANSVNYVGLSMGCVLFIPLARKYGRRLVYLLSIALMFVTSIWLGRIQSLTELYIANLLQGLAGATNESLVQITIADLFFVHHRGGMNALYMSMVMAGSFLTPIAAGTQAVNQGWRWSYYTLSIFNAVLLLLFVIGYEETKYIKVVDGNETSNEQNDTSAQQSATRVTSTQKSRDPQVMSKTDLPFGPSVGHHELDYSIPMNSWRKRLALFTPSCEPLWPHYYRPFYILIRFPTVLYTGLQYAAGVVWLTVMVTMFALVFPLPPYNFNPAQIGYLGIGPLIGNLIGAFYGGFLGDKCILFFARRNKGYYEPEMRLYIQHIPAVLLCGGLIMFGVTTQRGMHWIYSQIGGAFFGFGLGSISDAALTLVIDSYPGIVGDAFTAIAFLRNVVSIGIPFAINVWWANDGLQNMFLTCGFIGLAVAALAIPMVVWGRKSRENLGPLYQEMAMKNRQ